MSILQIDPFLTPRPEIAKLHEHLQPASEYYFVYSNHCSFSEFKERFPAAKFGGLAPLHGWHWHINERGLPNLRLAYTRGGLPQDSDQYLLPDPMTAPTQVPQDFICAFGYVVGLPKGSDAELHKSMAKQGYHRICQFVEYAQPRTNHFGQKMLVKARLKVVAYIDIKHTRDSNFSIIMSPAERAKWHQGIKELVRSGAPKWYYEKLVEKLRGRAVQVEPIFIKRNLELANRAQTQEFERANREANNCFEEESFLLKRDIVPRERQEDLAEENQRRDKARQQETAELERQTKRAREGESVETPLPKKQRVRDGDEDSISSRLRRRQKRVSFLIQDVDAELTDEDEGGVSRGD